MRVEGDGDGRWLAGVPGAELAEAGPARGARAARAAARAPDAVLDAARAAGTVTHFSLERPTLSRPVPRGGGGVSGREAVALVARREITERGAREELPDRHGRLARR